jgi:hypothetical protein
MCIAGGETVRGSRGGGRLAGGLIFEAEELCRINLGAAVSCGLLNFSLKDNSKPIKVPQDLASCKCKQIRIRCTECPRGEVLISGATTPFLNTRAS